MSSTPSTIRSSAGVAGWLLVAGYVGTLALYATTFGAYGAAMLSGGGGPSWLAPVLALLVVAVFLGINLFGAETSGRVELAIVGAKVAILALFAVAGHRSPSRRTTCCRCSIRASPRRWWQPG